MPNFSKGGYGDKPDFRRKSQKAFVDRPTNDVILRLHETDIVRVRPSGDVILCTGGWATHKTLHSMNDALELFNMWVEARGGIPRGEWVVYDSDGTTVPYKNDKVNYIVTIPGKTDEARQRCQWLAEAYQVAYTPRAAAAPAAAPQQQQQLRQQQGPQVVSAPPRPQVSAQPAAAGAGSRAAANGVHSSSWANVAKSSWSTPAAHAAPAAANTHAWRVTGPGAHVSGPGAASSSSAAAAAAAPAGPSSSPSQGGLRALDIARTKLQQQAKANEVRPVEEQLEEHMKKLGIQAEELEDDQHTCVVCMDHPRVTVLVPCGHMALCRECCKLLIEDKKNSGEDAKCPMCCQIVDYHVEVDS